MLCRCCRLQNEASFESHPLQHNSHSFKTGSSRDQDRTLNDVIDCKSQVACIKTTLKVILTIHTVYNTV